MILSKLCYFYYIFGSLSFFVSLSCICLIGCHNIAPRTDVIISENTNINSKGLKKGYSDQLSIARCST